MKYLISLFLVFNIFNFNFAFAETEFGNPKPSIEQPRKIIFQISDKDNKEIHHILSTANNVLKFYGPENVEMKIVCYYDGIKALMKKEKDIRVRIEALMTYDVEFIACENTIRTKNIDKKELLEDITYVTAGIVEVVERVVDGFIQIRP